MPREAHMATPMTPAQLLDQLREWDVPFKEYKSWRTHNRNHKGAWGPVNGFMVHHTGSDSKDQRELLYNGIAGLPGPLCHFGLAQDGTVHLIGWGRANHAGMIDDDVLRAVQNETAIPRDDESNTDGNARFYGVEVWYSGSHRMTDAQYATLRKLAAAICDAHGWGAGSVIGHGESGSPGKWDPGYAPGKMMDMDDVRADIKATLTKGKPSVPAPAPAPAKPAPKPSAPAKPVVDLSNVLAAAKRDPKLAQGKTTYAKDVKVVEMALWRAGFLNRAYASDGSFGTLTIKAYARWQRSLGYTGDDADGMPGRKSLEALGRKYGFVVKA
jgi:hypothetical protein